MRYNTSFETKLQEWKTEIGFDNGKPTVGIHVRLTDKIVEGAQTRHNLSQYMGEVEKYFQLLESLKNVKANSLQRRVFVASDNSSILAEAMQMYPAWKVFGFASKLSAGAERTRGLFEIVRDLAFLLESDFVICGFSSNICGLIHEMQSASVKNHLRNSSSLPQIKSLDGSYLYSHYIHNGPNLFSNKNIKIRKVSC